MLGYFLIELFPLKNQNRGGTFCPPKLSLRYLKKKRKGYLLSMYVGLD